MNYFDLIKTTTLSRPRRVLLYGTDGIGKSTWAAAAPNPLFIRTEDGADHLGVQALPLAQSIGEISQQLNWLATTETPFETIVIDTLDWAIRAMVSQVCQDAGTKSLNDGSLSFGKGKGQVTAGIQYLLDLCDRINKDQGKMVILLAHCEITRFEDPEGTSYDRYSPNCLNSDFAEIVTEWADEVLMASYRKYTQTVEEGFGRERTVAMGSGERMIYTTETPARKAKNRLNLPPELPMKFSAYYEHVQRAMNNGTAGIPVAWQDAEDEGSEKNGEVATTSSTK